MKSLPPLIRRTLLWQIGIAVGLTLLVGPLTYDSFSVAKEQLRPDIVPFCWFMGVLGYFAVASAIAALLLWKRMRIGVYVGLTVLPGIFWTAPGLLSDEMHFYLNGTI